MNRQMRRLAQKQKLPTPAESAKATAELRQQRAQRRAQQLQRQKGPRPSPIKYVRESIAELKKVDWPSRKEVWTYGVVVVITVVVLGTFVFGLDVLLAKAVFAFFKG